MELTINGQNVKPGFVWVLQNGHTVNITAVNFNTLDDAAEVIGHQMLVGGVNRDMVWDSQGRFYEGGVWNQTKDLAYREAFSDVVF